MATPIAGTPTATPLSSILTAVRNQIVEPTPRFWSDDELLAIMRLGAVDLWRAILDLHEDHYIRINDTDVFLRANDDHLSGVPADCFRIQLIEPADTSVSGNGHQIIFTPRKYKETDFAVARTLTAQDPNSLPSRQIYFQMVGLGPPIEAPHIVCAPKVSADLALRVVYNPGVLWDPNGTNPIPGESDHALKAWTVAYAQAKETKSNGGADGPDPQWIAVYATEKQSILTSLTPRQEQEPEVVEDMFQGYGSMW